MCLYGVTETQNYRENRNSVSLRLCGLLEPLNSRSVLCLVGTDSSYDRTPTAPTILSAFALAVAFDARSPTAMPQAMSAITALP